MTGTEYRQVPDEVPYETVPDIKVGVAILEGTEVVVFRMEFAARLVVEGIGNVVQSMRPGVVSVKLQAMRETLGEPGLQATVIRVVVVAASIVRADIRIDAPRGEAEANPPIEGVQVSHAGQLV